MSSAGVPRRASRPEPWQTDTCIGDWFYKSGLTYKSAKHVIAMLADIVSKNGNLLLNIPLKHDGTIDAAEEQVLGRPGRLDGGQRRGDLRHAAVAGVRRRPAPQRRRSFQRRHVRPDDRPRHPLHDQGRRAVCHRAGLAGRRPARPCARWPRPPGRSSASRCWATTDKLDWTQTDEGLVVTLPDRAVSEAALALKVVGQRPETRAGHAAAAMLPDQDGRFLLPAAEATIHGDSPRYEQGGGKDQIGYWANPQDFVAWDLQVAQARHVRRRNHLLVRRGAEGSEFTVEVGEQRLTGKSAPTGSWATYRTDVLGQLEFAKPGVYTLAVKPKAEPRWQVIGLHAVVLKPAR